ncbi:HAMP domain-containing histidine kinase [Desertifilum sp. FACHB-1129]|uniref:sensor histidine kinase n=1 Tax=unclassified Desertifilum TaxID=2621682 RepID=UPI0016878C90|nr:MULTISPECIES: HAMP domain-containing sensor histidine kinase [unclassified Desertifilum]MBD2313177.1 HAMP domain-containing histidine kinase [Desertifilum sp. FACHB-1129]MBD2323560.1 HAMP domain-containing histidine kinase [Desertifilum sp. FACHB-866]MBD2334079.1 HAMP domain-containing histidine kinase [Desertifilum sp. FACHB-868]MDA0212121.1 HAMP domain-containing sensor histidine kinase [Cyanobacteria bacterium FC1]
MNRDLLQFALKDNLSPPPLPGVACNQNLQGFCQQQIEQLIDYLPIVTAWIVYQDIQTQERYFVLSDTAKQPRLYVKHADSILNQSLDGSEGVLQVREVEWKSKAKAYFCLLRQDAGTFDYLLILSHHPLSVWQKEWVEKQAQSIHDYLTLCRECDRQHKKLLFLEHVIQRTEHQLRTPLSLIHLYAENLCLSLGDPQQEYALIIRETVSELSTTLTELLHCSQQAKINLESHDLRLILQESIQGLQPWIAEKGIQIHYPDTPLNLKVDRAQLKQVLDNLLSNAIYFSPPGEKINWSWHIFGHEALVEIEDRGPGLSEIDLKQAFNPFYSQRPGGTGLGLAIAKKVILDHQGSLWVQNLSPVGAQFSFSLPR